jgi:multiple sugar transport system permease protein
LLAPQALGFVAFGLAPLVEVAWYSLRKFRPLSSESIFVGFQNYSAILNDATMHEVFRVTLIFVGGLTLTGIPLALGLALLVNAKMPFIAFFRGVYFVPALISVAAWAILWRYILAPSGLADGILRTFGLGPPRWLNSPDWALFSVIFVQVLKNVGINMMLFLAALQAIPDELYEAARVDGAGSWSTFRRITIPLMAPAILMVTMLMLTGAFKVFETILLLTQGGPGVATSVLSFEIYLQAFSANNLGYASALAMILFVMVLVTVGLIWGARKRWVFHEQS